MTVSGVTAIVLSAGIALGGVTADMSASSIGIEDLGMCRITEYCPSCNDGSGHDSTSGVHLEYGHAACRWLPNGTVISIEGEEFVIVDTCGTDAIDIFRDTDECRCDLNEYRHVVVLKER